MLNLSNLQRAAIIVFMLVTLIFIIIPTLTMGVGGIIISAKQSNLSGLLGALAVGFIGVSGIMTFLLMNKCVYGKNDDALALPN